MNYRIILALHCIVWGIYTHSQSEVDTSDSIIADLQPQSTPLIEPDQASELIAGTATSDAFLNQLNTPSILALPKTPAQIQQAIEKVETSSEPDEEDRIELYFENTDLEQFAHQIEHIFGITFIKDDTISPVPEGTRTLKGNKISFRTHRPMSRQQAWNLFVTFLRLAGFSVIQEPFARIYRISPIESAKHMPLATYIGTDPMHLPNNEQLIRYIYFVENTPLETITRVVDSLKSTSATLIRLDEVKGFLLVDQTYNIKSLMKIVKELDRVNMPQAMSVLKLHRADATDVEKLYKTLVPQEDKSITARLTARKKQTGAYFPENTRVIAEPRTNSLILLGAPEAIKRIEQFIIAHVDVEIDHPYSSLQVYQLKYAEAETIAKIMNEITQFGKESEASRTAQQVGGVRSGDKYLRDMTFTAEKATNRLIIRGEYEDYIKVKEIIEKLDQEAAQVAIEVLVLSINLNEIKQLGAQIRTNENNGNGLLGNNIKFQTSGLFAGGTPKGIVTNNATGTTGAQRLLGDLINLAVNAPAGNTIVSLGQDMFGVWGIFQTLQTITNTQILANPFLVATNKTKAEVSNGETIRIITGQIIGTNNTNTFGDDKAELTVKVTPQINSDGMILLNLEILLSAFLSSPTDQLNVVKAVRELNTETIVADREVLALGGLIQTTIDNAESKVPILGDIPVVGWLFKNKQKSENKSTLLILVSTHIIEPHSEEQVREFTKERIENYQGMLNPLDGMAEKKDPVHKYFFANEGQGSANAIDNFLFERREKHAQNIPKKRDKRMRRLRHKKDKPNKSAKAMIVENQKVPQVPIVESTVIAQNQNTQDGPVQSNTAAPIEQLAQRTRSKKSLADLMASEQKGAVV